VEEEHLSLRRMYIDIELVTGKGEGEKDERMSASEKDFSINVADGPLQARTINEAPIDEENKCHLACLIRVGVADETDANGLPTNL
jgi:hypothetical protein